MVATRTYRVARAVRRATAAVGGMAAALSLAACGPTSGDYAEPSMGGDGRTPPAPEVPLPDACSLLTTSQIKAAANAVLSEGSTNAGLSTAARSVCEWTTAGSPSPFVQVLVTVGADTISSERAAAEASMGPSEDWTVIGGGSAYIIANGNILGMRVGDYFVQVTYLAGDSANARVVTTALAQDVAKAL